MAPAEYQTFVCSFISNCNMAFQAVSWCFVTQLWSRGPGTAAELGSASVRLCPSCPIASINQKGSIKVQFSTKCSSLIQIPKLRGVQEKPKAEMSHHCSPCLPSPKHGTSLWGQGHHSLLLQLGARGLVFSPSVSDWATQDLHVNSKNWWGCFCLWKKILGD